jgi:hypothetical protein
MPELFIVMVSEDYALHIRKCDNFVSLILRVATCLSLLKYETKIKTEIINAASLVSSLSQISPWPLDREVDKPLKLSSWVIVIVEQNFLFC